MEIAHTVTWDDGKRRRAAAMVAVLAFALLASPVARAGGEELGKLISVIVRDTPAAGESPERFVEHVGGNVVHRYDALGGFSAMVPRASVETLAGMPGVIAVTPNGALRMLGKADGGGSEVGSLDSIASDVRAQHMWNAGVFGQGVDVALIDTGVAPVQGLDGAGKILNGPDLSFESQAENLRYLDTYGHGTHMAGIIAGKDPRMTYSLTRGAWSRGFVGIAPDARIVNVKVGSARGATDVSQVIAAIDWVVQNRNKNGLNIRVLNLSFGTESTQSYILDPLAFAAEVAWRKGIFVVAAAGNNGKATGQLANPAFSPRIFAVGANDTQGSTAVSDDVIPSWSSRGDGIRNPDVVAPGRSVKSLRVEGSYIDQQHPSAIDGRLFTGSGTSQAAAVVSGAAALVISQRPGISPDQLKKLFRDTAQPLPAANLIAQGRGMLDLKAASNTATPSALLSAQSFSLATGLGSLEASRGGVYVEMDGVLLQGEKDIFGNTFSSSTWAPLSWDGASWNGGTWNGATWSGASWSGASWSGATWSGASWSGASWSGATWSGATWSGASWSGASWSGASWSGATWSGASWSGASWSSATWA